MYTFLEPEQGIEYSLRTFKHKIVLAQKLNENEIQIQAIEPGSKGNVPVAVLGTVYDPLNRFLTPTLEGGKDCDAQSAIQQLAEKIEEVSKREERRNKDRYTCSYTGNELTVTHILHGKKFNNIVCTSNVTEVYQTPYLIMESVDLVNLNDFISRTKQIAKWKNYTFSGGEDPTIEVCVKALKKAIEDNQKDEILVSYFTKDDGTDDTSGLNIEYMKIGEKGNVPLNTSCMNGKLSGKRLKGGIDGLEANEELYINCEREEIISSKDKDRYKNLINKNSWLEIPLDGIALRVKKGYFKIAFRYRETYYI